MTREKQQAESHIDICGKMVEMMGCNNIVNDMIDVMFMSTVTKNKLYSKALECTSQMLLPEFMVKAMAIGVLPAKNKGVALDVMLSHFAVIGFLTQYIEWLEAGNFEKYVKLTKEGLQNGKI